MWSSGTGALEDASYWAQKAKEVVHNRSEEIVRQRAGQATHAGDLKAVADALEDQWFQWDPGYGYTSPASPVV